MNLEDQISKMDPMALVTQYNLLQNGPPEESKLATYMVCLDILFYCFICLSLVFGSLLMHYNFIHFNLGTKKFDLNFLRSYEK